MYTGKNGILFIKQNSYRLFYRVGMFLSLISFVELEEAVCKGWEQ